VDSTTNNQETINFGQNVKSYQGKDNMTINNAPSTRKLTATEFLNFLSCC